MVPSGSLRYQALADAESLKSDFATSPVEVLVTLLCELGGEATILVLEREARALGIGAEQDRKWWSRMRGRLLADPRVTGAKDNAKGPLRLAPVKQGGSPADDTVSVEEALAALLAPATKSLPERRRALTEAFAVHRTALTPYELLAARSRGVALDGWPAAPGDYTTEGTSVEVLAAAVAFLAEVTKGQRRPNRPVAAPSAALTKSGVPPAEPLRV